MLFPVWDLSYCFRFCILGSRPRLVLQALWLRMLLVSPAQGHPSNGLSCCNQGCFPITIPFKNSLYSAKDDNSQLKAIDFGLSDFAKPDERLDIVGSAYYVTLEVLHRSYSTEADVWSIGVISYILLCGSRPFWAWTESGTFRAVLKADTCFDEALWPSLSLEAKDVVKHLLNKDPRK